MTEDRLRSLLTEYAEPLHYQPRPPRRAIAPWALVGVGTAAVATLLVLSPTQGAAAAIRRMEAALANVETMRVENTYSIERSPSRIRNGARLWYRKGAWRVQAFPGYPIEKTFLFANGTQHVFSPRDKTLLREPLGDWWYDGRMTALDFAKRYADLGYVGVERTTRIEPVDAAMYRIVLERSEGAYRCEILIDRKTDLPLKSTVSDGAGGERQTNVFSFHFGEPLDSALFDPRSFRTPVIDLVAEQERLLRMWARPLVEYRDLNIVDARVNREGELFLAVSAPQNSISGGRWSPRLPKAIYDDRGTVYLRTADYFPGGVRGDTNTQRRFRLPGREFGFSLWVPLEPLSNPPRQVVLDFGERRIDLALPSPIQKRFPDYSTALVLDDLHRQKTREIARVRAEFYRKRGDYESELPWRWAQYDAARDYTPGFGRLEVPDLARCLENLGRKTDADRVRRELG